MVKSYVDNVVFYSDIYDYNKEYIDFRNNKFKFDKKSVYERRYHLENRLIDNSHKYKFILTHDQRIKIGRIFSEIKKVKSQVNAGRKRIININFIIRKIMELMKLKICKKSL